ncbi:MAG: hypothetical protein AB9888_02105 [Bacteroidales bacterium]
MNALPLVYLIAQVIFVIGFLLSPGLMMDPMGVTLDETSTTFARLLGSLLISIPVLLFFVRKSQSPEFRRAVAYCAFTYLLLSTIILLITQLKGLMNPLGWSIVMIHFTFMVWFGYYLINQTKKGYSR